MLKLVGESLLVLRASGDPEVKKNALDGLTTIAHANWGVLKDCLGDLEQFAH